MKKIMLVFSFVLLLCFAVMPAAAHAAELTEEEMLDYVKPYLAVLHGFNEAYGSELFGISDDISAYYEEFTSTGITLEEFTEEWTALYEYYAANGPEYYVYGFDENGEYGEILFTHDQAEFEAAKLGAAENFATHVDTMTTEELQALVIAPRASKTLYNSFYPNEYPLRLFINVSYSGTSFTGLNGYGCEHVIGYHWYVIRFNQTSCTSTKVILSSDLCLFNGSTQLPTTRSGFFAEFYASSFL